MTAFALPQTWLAELHARAHGEGTSASAILRHALRVELDMAPKENGPRGNAGPNNRSHDEGYGTARPRALRNAG
jgi:hypothetical protein